MNAIRRLFTPAGAVTRWQTHIAEVRERIAAEDRQIQEFYQKVVDADTKAMAELAETPSLEGVKRSINAGAARQAAEASWSLYQRLHGNALETQADKKLDMNLLQSAIDEARREINKRKAEAMKSVEQAASDSATSAADFQRNVDESFARRLKALDDADRVLRHTRESTPERQFYPKGITLAASFLDAALA